ncbi:MAG TPA: 4Fe-4S binding protein, partial [Coriobacteriia bacterium]|nr:4Fe-4S binding protein [Coriobacteriia bacterium]
MGRALIVFLSLGGTTSRVARHIARGLGRADIDADLCNLSRPVGAATTNSDLADYDLIGVGSPAHYYRASPPVMRFLRDLPRLDGRGAFTFTLHGTYPGRTARDLRVGLEKRGATHLGGFSSRGADRYVAYMRKGVLFSAGHPDETDLDAAEAFGEGVGRRWSERDPKPVPAAPPSPEVDVTGIYRLERLLTAPLLARHLYSRLFRLDGRRCTGCGACARRCPVGNITLDPDQRPHWGRECILCLYCELICPEEAITSPIGLPPFDSFVTHNVRVAAADPDLDHARV